MRKLFYILFICLLLPVVTLAEPTEPTLPPEPDRTRLRQLLTEMNADYINETNYTPDSLALFSQARTQAEICYENKEATEQELADAATALKQAYYALVPLFHTDTAPLTAILNAPPDLSPYLPSSTETYKNALQNAENLLQQKNITPYDVTKALTALETAEKAFIPKPDKSHLQAYLSALEQLEQQSYLYTAESLTMLQDAKAELTRIQADPETTQDSVTGALELYQNTVRKMELLPPEEAPKPLILPESVPFFAAAGACFVLALTLSLIFCIKFRKKS